MKNTLRKSRSKNVLVVFVLVWSVCATPTAAEAWGPKGHALVGQIAYRLLSEGARKNVQSYLGLMPFDTAANWMDAMRSNYEYDFMKPWHYVNYEKGLPYVPSPEDNVLNRLTYTFNELKHKQLLCNDQVKFDILVLFHLIGDIHQPLHAGYGEDKGGNGRQVEYLDTAKVNLHHVWDENLVDRSGVTLESILPLQKSLLPDQAKQVASLNFIEWMNESRMLLPQAYAFPDYRLDEAYAQKNENLVKMRLLFAGMRLAAVLEKLFQSAVDKVPEPVKGSISAEEAKNHIDKKVTVCSKVYGVKATDKVTFINVGARFPNSPLTAVIFAKDYVKFKGSIEDMFNNKNICITGKVVEYNGKAEIIIDNQDQIMAQ